MHVQLRIVYDRATITDCDAIVIDDDRFRVSRMNRSKRRTVSGVAVAAYFSAMGLASVSCVSDCSSG